MFRRHRAGLVALVLGLSAHPREAARAGAGVEGRGSVSDNAVFRPQRRFPAATRNGPPVTYDWGMTQHSRRKKTRPWWRRPISDKSLEKKFGIFGTRGGVLLLVAIIVGLIATPWLLWFVVLSIALGILFAFFGPFRRREDPSISIVDEKDRPE